MKTICPNRIAVPIASVFLGMGSLSAATTVIDWLQLAPGATAASFALNNDIGGMEVSGSILPEPGKGLSFPGYPNQTSLSAAGWDSALSFEDSIVGVPQVMVTNVRVVPQSGSANYRIEMTVPANVQMIFVIGGLFAGASGATDSVIASALTDSNPGVFTLIEMAGWSNGVQVDSQPLVWSESLATLSTLSGSEGDSGYAFLHLAPLVGANPRVTFSVPQGFASGAGDEISIGVGIPIPEPSAPMLMAGAVLLGTFRRRR